MNGKTAVGAETPQDEYDPESRKSSRRLERSIETGRESMLKLKHKSAVRSRDSGGASYREIYYGTKEEVEERSSGLTIGDRDRSGEYELVSWRTRQIGGPVYEIELN